jgi:hypothetical protein
VNISELSADGVAERLRRRGLAFHCGPFLIRVVSTIPAIARGLCLLYGDMPLAESEEFVDYHLEFNRARGLRGWVKPLVAFNFDGSRPFNPLVIAQAYPLFEWALNWCIAFHSHQYLILHAAVVERDGRTLIMPAPPGSGKSTLTAALISRGWRLFSDEMALIDIATRRLVPAPRPVCLKNESLEVIRRFVPGAVLSGMTHDTAKGTIAHMKAPAEHVHRAGETATSGWIVAPKYVAGAAATLAERPKAGAHMYLARNAFNYAIHGRAGFDMVADLVESSGCFDFHYGDLDEAVACLDRLPASGSA